MPSARRLFFSLSRSIDSLFAWLKWPFALLSLVLLPGAAVAMLELLRRIVLQPSTMQAFLLGLAAYMVVWWLAFRHTRFSFFLTLEHELTHALFAVLTFHRVVSIRATIQSGGQMQFEGQGNWLITLAPYFFPTATIFLIGVMMPLPTAWLSTANAVIGASFAYHLTSTLRETHIGQTDIQRAGMIFCLLVLPTANLLSAGVILAFSHDGLGGLSRFLAAVGQQSRWLLPWS